MANNNTTTTVQEFTAEARFVMHSFDEKDKDGNKIGEKEYIALELIEPFGSDELFKDVSVKAKWETLDDKTGRVVRPDRVFGLMKYYAKKALRTASEVKVNVTIKPVRYKNKNTGGMVTYPGIFVDPTFVELEDEKPVELVVKGGENANIFNHLAGRKLGIKFTTKDPDDDAGLFD